VTTFSRNDIIGDIDILTAQIVKMESDIESVKSKLTYKQSLLEQLDAVRGATDAE